MQSCNPTKKWADLPTFFTEWNAELHNRVKRKQRVRNPCDSRDLGLVGAPYFEMAYYVCAYNPFTSVSLGLALAGAGRNFWKEISKLMISNIWFYIWL